MKTSKLSRSQQSWLRKSAIIKWGYISLVVYKDFLRSMGVQLVWKELISRSSNSQSLLSRINLSEHLIKSDVPPPTLHKKDMPSHPKSDYFVLPGDPPPQKRGQLEIVVVV